MPRCGANDMGRTQFTSLMGCSRMGTRLYGRERWLPSPISAPPPFPAADPSQWLNQYGGALRVVQLYVNSAGYRLNHYRPTGTAHYLSPIMCVSTTSKCNMFHAVTYPVFSHLGFLYGFFLNYAQNQPIESEGYRTPSPPLHRVGYAYSS